VLCDLVTCDKGLQSPDVAVLQAADGFRIMHIFSVINVSTHTIYTN
jgi:hypothetical protein